MNSHFDKIYFLFQFVILGEEKVASFKDLNNKNYKYHWSSLQFSSTKSLPFGQFTIYQFKI